MNRLVKQLNTLDKPGRWRARLIAYCLAAALGLGVGWAAGRRLAEALQPEARIVAPDDKPVDRPGRMAGGDELAQEWLRHKSLKKLLKKYQKVRRARERDDD